MRRIIIAMAAFCVAACGSEPGKSNEAAAQTGGQPATSAAADDLAPNVNLLSLSEGAVLVSASANEAAAWALIDGDPRSSWSNGGPRAAGPHIFVFELRAPTTLRRVGLDNPGARPRGGATGPAGAVRIEGSATSADAGFRDLARFTAAPDGETLADAAPGAPVRWVRVTVEAVAGTNWTYVDELIAYGDQTSPAGNFTGIFVVGPRAYVELKQTGASITGCYVEQSGHANGEITGDVVDGVARLQWRRTDGPEVSGVALLVIDSRGRLNGVRYRDRSRSIWAGPPAPDGTATPCSEAAPPANPISVALAEEGEARIYGILFDFDSATLKSSSTPALQQLLEALQANAAMNVDIEGHTDNVGADSYNLDLSQRRAQSVVAWLTERGVPATRLNPVGKGETTPVASNDTADGRALNRRVEVRRR